MTSAKRPVVSIYACGGTGINIGYVLANSNGIGQENIHCDYKVRYVDTSTTNFTGKDINIESQAFVFNTKGAGQVRGSIYEYVRDTHLDVFRKFPPTDINVVLFSTSGGSGSVISPVLASTLISSGRPTFLVGIGAVDTLKHAKNTRDTIKTLQGISNSIKKPVIFNYHENLPGHTEANTNKNAIFNIVTTAILLSGVVERIDDTDIANWLNYVRVTDQDPSLTGFHVVVGNDPLAETVQPFAALSIHRTENVVPRHDRLDFKKIGFLNNIPGDADSIHFYLDKPSVQSNYNRINGLVSELETISEQRKMSFDFGADNGDENGFVL